MGKKRKLNVTMSLTQLLRFTSYDGALRVTRVALKMIHTLTSSQVMSHSMPFRQYLIHKFIFRRGKR